jgi:hypothetical protein
MKKGKRSAVSKKKRGRPRGENLMAGIKAASAELGIPIGVLQMMRAAGCPAFRQDGRIHRDTLLKWRAENSDKMPDANDMVSQMHWTAEDKKAIAETRMHKLALLRREAIRVTEVKLKFTRAVLDAKKAFTEVVRTLMQEVTLHCAANEAQIAWAMALGEKRLRAVLTALSSKEFCGVTCPKCKTEIKING